MTPEPICHRHRPVPCDVCIHPACVASIAPVERIPIWLVVQSRIDGGWGAMPFEAGAELVHLPAQIAGHGSRWVMVAAQDRDQAIGIWLAAREAGVVPAYGELVQGARR